jgi:hypothetical protein
MIMFFKTSSSVRDQSKIFIGKLVKGFVLSLKYKKS